MEEIRWNLNIFLLVNSLMLVMYNGVSNERLLKIDLRLKRRKEIEARKSDRRDMTKCKSTEL